MPKKIWNFFSNVILNVVICNPAAGHMHCKEELRFITPMCTLGSWRSIKSFLRKINFLTNTHTKPYFNSILLPKCKVGWHCWKKKWSPPIFPWQLPLYLIVTWERQIALSSSGERVFSLVANEAAYSHLVCINTSSLKAGEPTNSQCWHLHFQGHRLDTI